MYKKMAEVYDLLMSDAPYDNWLNFTEAAISYNEVSHVLEVGCGTGELALKLSNKGYDVTAFDVSCEMIEVAQQKAKVQNSNCQFFQGEASSFDINQSFDLVVSYCDVLNYIVEPSALNKTFKNIFKHLNDDGIFIFDVHSIAYVDWLIEREIFSEIREEITHIWLCEPGMNEGEIQHDLTFFVQRENQLYERYDEQHVQRTYPVQYYKQVLNDIGFEKVDIYYDFHVEENEKAEEDADRIFFVCSKK
ncbi:class I SAM-dependent methyltransferase [Filobacillus milosensis]|uniref:Class I SAM-dependent methyltransferase n=1 Tax=Filobacillus milosensis TaxID=94137 RepID=A0A4Y8IUK2_9BACI|nr:class I SAM-dependent methyltransferase [Filobacillus milosensis]TFB24869.1 class I SAM-dependent methyltransferase [Filobacillus milosensis]